MNFYQNSTKYQNTKHIKLMVMIFWWCMIISYVPSKTENNLGMLPYLFLNIKYSNKGYPNSNIQLLTSEQNEQCIYYLYSESFKGGQP